MIEFLEVSEVVNFRVVLGFFGGGEGLGLKGCTSVTKLANNG